MLSINASMENLPDEILSRLPVKTIIHCKCVCKKGQNLVLNSYFINLHLSRSPAGLMVHHDTFTFKNATYRILKWVGIEDKLDHHYLDHDPIMNFDFIRYLATLVPNIEMIPVGSVNGLICISQRGVDVDNVFICNPITREYLTLPRQRNYRDGHGAFFYNFGVNSVTGEYKVLRIFRVDVPTYPFTSIWPSLEAEVYTLGTSQWRSLGQVPYKFYGVGRPFLNGYFHWIDDDHQGIFTFDLDNETFQSFPSPPIESKARVSRDLAVLKGCLCQYDICDSQFTIWVMKEYGIKKSWHKEVAINQTICPDLDWTTIEFVVLIEGLQDGSILIVRCGKLLAYCPQSKTIKDLEISASSLSVFVHRPSFLKLQNIDSERVHVF